MILYGPDPAECNTRNPNRVQPQPRMAVKCSRPISFLKQAAVPPPFQMLAQKYFISTTESCQATPPGSPGHAALFMKRLACLKVSRAFAKCCFSWVWLAAWAPLDAWLVWLLGWLGLAGLGFCTPCLDEHFVGTLLLTRACWAPSASGFLVGTLTKIFNRPFCKSQARSRVFAPR